jgi:hypothetical protein
MATNKIQKFINDQKEFIIEISSIGTSKGFKQTLSDFRDDIDKVINTLDFDERYLLKKKFDDEMESIFNSVDSKKIPHSDYVCQMFCEVVDDGIKSGINRIRIKSELKNPLPKSTQSKICFLPITVLIRGTDGSKTSMLIKRKRSSI